MTIPEYYVYFFVYHNPLELADRINEVCQDEKLILVATTGNYFIFKDSDAEFTFRMREG